MICFNTEGTEGLTDCTEEGFYSEIILFFSVILCVELCALCVIKSYF